jgi:hypothetical protein
MRVEDPRRNEKPYYPSQQLGPIKSHEHGDHDRKNDIEATEFASGGGWWFRCTVREVYAPFSSWRAHRPPELRLSISFLPGSVETIFLLLMGKNQHILPDRRGLRI